MRNLPAKVRQELDAKAAAEARRNKPKPTNADRIRAMSDKELAAYGVYGFNLDGVTVWRGHFDGFADTEAEAIQRELDWLQQPAPEEGEQNV